MKMVGTLYLDERRADKIEKAHQPQIAEKVREICSRQVDLNGDGKPFRFKALGFTWRYVPERSAP